MTESGGLDKRKAYILATVVYEYIATAEPVGSQALTQKYNLGVSSATVRNEMAELEAGGYLVQPHTSAGRIPSDAGYRTYVDRLMQPEELAEDDRRRIRDELYDASRELDDIIDHTTRLLGRLSNNLAFVTQAAARDADASSTFSSFGSRRIPAWRSSSPRSASPRRASSNSAPRCDPDDLTRFSNALNARFANRSLRGSNGERDRAARRKRSASPTICAPRSASACLSARSSEQPAIAAAGAQNLLDQPEFHDLRKLRSILRIVEEQKTLYRSSPMR